MRRIRIATYLVLGLSAVLPAAFVVYNFLRYGSSDLLSSPSQAIITIGLILFMFGPYAFAGFMVALLPKNKASCITMFVGSLLVAALPWLSVIFLVWKHFRCSPHHDMEIAGRLIWVIGPCLQWLIVLMAVAMAYLLGGRTFRKQVGLMFVGMALLLAIFWLSVKFYFPDPIRMALSCWLGLLVVVVLVLLLVYSRPRLAKIEA